MHVQPGDTISYRFSLTARHYGIYAGNGKVIENRIGGVGYATLRDFKKRKAFRIDARAKPGTARRVIARAKSKLGQPYWPISSNCEHLATYAQTGAPKSGQVLNALVGVGAVAVVAGVGYGLFKTSGWDPNTRQFRARNGRYRRGPRWWPGG